MRLVGALLRSNASDKGGKSSKRRNDERDAASLNAEMNMLSKQVKGRDSARYISHRELGAAIGSYVLAMVVATFGVYRVINPLLSGIAAAGVVLGSSALISFRKDLAGLLARL